MWFNSNFFIPPKQFKSSGEEGQFKDSSFTITGENKAKDSSFGFSGEKKE